MPRPRHPARAHRLYQYRGLVRGVCHAGSAGVAAATDGADAEGGRGGRSATRQSGGAPDLGRPQQGVAARPRQQIPPPPGPHALPLRSVQLCSGGQRRPHGHGGAGAPQGNRGVPRRAARAPPLRTVSGAWVGCVGGGACFGALSRAVGVHTSFVAPPPSTHSARWRARTVCNPPTVPRRAGVSACLSARCVCLAPALRVWVRGSRRSGTSTGSSAA